MAGKGKRGPQPETPEAMQAFEDFWALGDDRTLDKLAAFYQHRKRTGQAVPTTQRRTLAGWSSKWGWQARLAARIAEDAAASRAAFRKRVQAHRERLLGALEVDSSRYIKRLQKGAGEDLVTDMAALEKATKLYFQLAEDPLAEKHEVEHSGEIAVSTYEHLSTEELAAIAAAGEDDTGAEGGAAGED